MKELYVNLDLRVNLASFMLTEKRVYHKRSEVWINLYLAKSKVEIRMELQDTAIRPV
jgi:hypothetical protein